MARAAVPWHLHAVLFASVSVIVGVLCDISWHQSIGRDTFWSPPHMAIYLGGVVAGVVCGWWVLTLAMESWEAPGGGRWSPLLSDHGKLMHMFLVRQPGTGAFAAEVAAR